MGRTLVALAALGLALLVAVVGVRLFQEPDCPAGESSPAPVLVVKRLIPSGTSGSVIVRRRVARTVSVRCADLEQGAISDPTYLAGQVATVDLFPGQQLTAEDFAPP